MSDKLPEVVYTPESRINNSASLLKGMRTDLLASRELAWRLIVRDVSAQYRQTLLGYFWAFVPALVTGVALTVASNNQVISFGESKIPYTAYVVVGMVLWQTFMESMTLQLQTMSNAREMLSKINFPREALILSALGQTLFGFLVKSILIVATMLWYGLSPPASIVLAPIALLMLLALGTGIGVLLAPIGGLYEDVARAVSAGALALLTITPVVFVSPQQGTFSRIVEFNPITPLLVTTRDLMTTGDLTYPIGFPVGSFFALLLLFVAWSVYRLAMPIVIERMNA